MTYVMNGILQELRSAKAKWPGWPVDPIHAASVLSEEAGELVQAANDFCYSGGSVEQMELEARQVAAMAVRFLEGLDRYKRVQGYE
jgi:NTP pyrophosphatase (non-canonical NTP hydrolase)